MKPIKVILIFIYTLTGYTICLAQNTNPNLCNSLIDKYIFMHGLDLSTNGHGYNSDGNILEQTNIYCEPFDSARVLRQIESKYVQLTQKGYFNGQDWYKINLHDSIQTIGYVKGEAVSFLGTNTNPCNNNYCNYLYYSLQAHAIDQYINRKVFLRTINPLDSTYRNFFLTEETRTPDVKIQYLKQIEKSDFYYVQVERESPGYGVLGAYFILLVNREDGNITLLHKEDYLGTEDGLKQVNIYYNYGHQYMYSFKSPLDGFPPDTVPTPKSIPSSNLVLIITHTKAPMLGKGGITLQDENGMIRLQVTGNTKQWYDIKDGKFVPIILE